MSQLVVFNSSSSFLNTYPNSFALAHSNNPQNYNPMAQEAEPFEFQPSIKSPAYVIGEQLVAPLVTLVLKVSHFFYSRLPSLTLPGTLASSVSACDAAVVCRVPTGSYEESCHRPQVTYLTDENECLLKTRCATYFEEISHRKVDFRFPPGEDLVLVNRNGTLVISREGGINKRLNELFTTRLTREDLLRKQGEIIGTLNPGDVVTINDSLKPEVILPEDQEGTNAFNAFRRIASATGGIMGYSSFSEGITPLIETMSLHILKAAVSSESLDIAFLIDTTISMNPYITQIKNNLVRFLTQLQAQANNNCRVALLEYRDVDAQFLNRVNIDFSSNLAQVQKAINELEIGGGGDLPEAILDGLLAAKNQLSWNPRAKRIVVLLGDEPPKPRTVDGLDEAAVLGQYQAAGTQISVYPILSAKGAR